MGFEVFGDKEYRLQIGIVVKFLTFSSLLKYLTKFEENGHGSFWVKDLRDKKKCHWVLII